MNASIEGNELLGVETMAKLERQTEYLKKAQHAEAFLNNYVAFLNMFNKRYFVLEVYEQCETWYAEIWQTEERVTSIYFDLDDRMSYEGASSDESREDAILNLADKLTFNHYE